jgi:hypothetical protein
LRFNQRIVERAAVVHHRDQQFGSSNARVQGSLPVS